VRVSSCPSICAVSGLGIAVVRDGIRPGRSRRRRTGDQGGPAAARHRGRRSGAAGVGRRDLSLIAVTIGPGSFNRRARPALAAGAQGHCRRASVLPLGGPLPTTWVLARTSRARAERSVVCRHRQPPRATGFLRDRRGRGGTGAVSSGGGARSLRYAWPAGRALVVGSGHASACAANPRRGWQSDAVGRRGFCPIPSSSPAWPPMAGVEAWARGRATRVRACRGPPLPCGASTSPLPDGGAAGRSIEWAVDLALRLLGAPRSRPCRPHCTARSFLPLGEACLDPGRDLAGLLGLARLSQVCLLQAESRDGRRHRGCSASSPTRRKTVDPPRGTAGRAAARGGPAACLMAVIDRVAARLGRQTLFLEVGADNPPARGALRGHGLSGDRPRARPITYFAAAKGRPADALVMRLSLKLIRKWSGPAGSFTIWALAVVFDPQNGVAFLACRRRGTFGRKGSSPMRRTLRNLRPAACARA